MLLTVTVVYAVTISLIKFASLPTKFATVGKLELRRSYPRA
jgi:hypothetical protein